MADLAFLVLGAGFLLAVELVFRRLDDAPSDRGR